MTGGFNNLITALIVVFAVTFAGLLAEIFYILWRRRQTPDTGGLVGAAQAKERGFFLCWRKQSRIEPNELQTRTNDDSEADEEEKWRQLCGVSRVLFTITEEEEREGMESECCCSALDEKKLNQETDIRIQVDDDLTPFGTPCGSPPYYTPSPSPAREHGGGSGDFTTVSDDDSRETAA